MTRHAKRHPSAAQRPLGHVTVMAAVLLTSLCSAVIRDEAPSQPGSGFDFAVVDTDGSGCVQGLEETQQFRLHVGKILEESLKLSKLESALRAGLITHSADVNNDGKICECDLLSILLADSSTNVDANKHAFRVYEDGSIFDGVDADDDGFLGDSKELEGLIQKLAQCVSEARARRVVDAMSKLDKQDGKLSREEYMLFLKSPLQIGSTPAPQPQPQPQPTSSGSQPGQQPDGDEPHKEGDTAGSEQSALAAGGHVKQDDSPHGASSPANAGVQSPEQQPHTPQPHPPEKAQSPVSPSHPVQAFPPGSQPAKRPADLPPPPPDRRDGPVIEPRQSLHQLPNRRDGPVIEPRLSLHPLPNRRDGPAIDPRQSLHPLPNRRDGPVIEPRQSLHQLPNRRDGPVIEPRLSLHPLPNRRDGPAIDPRQSLHPLPNRRDGPVIEPRLPLHPLPNRRDGPAIDPRQSLHPLPNRRNGPVIESRLPIGLRSQPQQAFFSPLGLPGSRQAFPRRPPPERSLVIAANQRPRPPFLSRGNRPAPSLAAQPGQVLRRRMLTNPAAQQQQQRFQRPMLQPGQFFHAVHQAGASSRAANQPPPQPASQSAQVVQNAQPVGPAAKQPPQPLKPAEAAPPPPPPPQPVRSAQPSKLQVPQQKNLPVPALVETAKNPPRQPESAKNNSPAASPADADAPDTKPTRSADEGGKKKPDA